MTDDDIKKLEDTHNAEHELYRAKEWFWNWPDAEVVKDERGQWVVRWSQQLPHGVMPDRENGGTKQEALLNAYRVAVEQMKEIQEMEGAE